MSRSHRLPSGRAASSAHSASSAPSCTRCTRDAAEELGGDLYGCSQARGAHLNSIENEYYKFGFSNTVRLRVAQSRGVWRAARVARRSACTWRAVAARRSIGAQCRRGGAAAARSHSAHAGCARVTAAGTSHAEWPPPEAPHWATCATDTHNDTMPRRARVRVQSRRFHVSTPLNNVC